MNRASGLCQALLLMILAVGLCPRPATAATYEILYKFTGTDGAYPSGLVADKAGNLYGITHTGSNSPCGCGTIFELSPPTVAGGKWTETTLYSFTGGLAGTNPDQSLAMGPDGSLFGEMFQGGNPACYNGGCGTIYKLSPPAAGRTGWTFAVIHVFGHAVNGAFPSGGLTVDSSGAVYGTTEAGGNAAQQCERCGEIFKLTPPATGHVYSYSIIHQFSDSQGGSGYLPLGKVIQGANGVLYGSTLDGGRFGHGVVFQLSPPSAVQTAWQYADIHNFGLTVNGAGPAAGLVLGQNGVLYGAAGGGPYCYSHDSNDQCGVIFSLTPPIAHGGAWAYGVTHEFGLSANGAFPGGLAVYQGGKLYGVASAGGVGSCDANGATGCGVTFLLLPPASANTSWTYGITHYFKYPVNGIDPNSTLIVDQNNNIFGTTFEGGDVMCGHAFASCGLVYEIH